MELQYEIYTSGNRKTAADPSMLKVSMGYYEELLKKVRRENA